MKNIQVDLNEEELTLIICALSSVNKAIFIEASSSKKGYGKVIAEGWLNGAFKNKALYEKLVKIQKKLN